MVAPSVLYVTVAALISITISDAFALPTEHIPHHVSHSSPSQRLNGSTTFLQHRHGLFSRSVTKTRSLVERALSDPTLVDRALDASFVESTIAPLAESVNMTTKGDVTSSREDTGGLPTLVIAMELVPTKGADGVWKYEVKMLDMDDWDVVPQVPATGSSGVGSSTMLGTPTPSTQMTSATSSFSASSSAVTTLPTLIMPLMTSSTSICKATSSTATPTSSGSPSASDTSSGMVVTSSTVSTASLTSPTSGTPTQSISGSATTTSLASTSTSSRGVDLDDDEECEEWVYEDELDA